MHHLSSPAETRAYLATIIARIRGTDNALLAKLPLTLPVLMAALADGGNDPVSIVLVLNAIAQFTNLDDESEVITIQGPYERHDDETLARMVWQALLRNACGQHAPHS